MTPALGARQPGGSRGARRSPGVGAAAPATPGVGWVGRGGAGRGEVSLKPHLLPGAHPPGAYVAQPRGHGVSGGRPQ